MLSRDKKSITREISMYRSQDIGAETYFSFLLE